MDDVKEVTDKNKKEIFDCLNGIDSEKINIDGLSIRLGGKILKFEVVSSNPVSELEEVRNEFKEKLTIQLQKIKTKVNSILTDNSNFIYSIKKEYDKKEKELKDRLNKSQSMPDVTFSHAKKGLSIVKGKYKDELMWFVNGIYWPKYVDGIPIDVKFSKKMLTTVVFCIKTSGSSITECSTRKIIGLDFFDHYHQNNPDCWGKWNHKKSWSKPEDIIATAKEMEVVLENINTYSIAKKNPQGLPRIATLERHILDNTDKSKYNEILSNVGDLSTSISREGVSISPPNVIISDDNIWTS